MHRKVLFAHFTHNAAFNSVFNTTLNAHKPYLRSSRGYYAATTKNASKIESRLVKGDNGLTLEIMEPYKYKKYNQYHAA
jgi:hypothetical protein